VRPFSDSPRRGTPSLLLALLAGALLVLAGCSSTPVRPVAPAAPSALPADSATLWQQYRAAVADARSAEPGEIATSLTPIAPYVASLVRKETAMPGARMPGARALVKVAHWTDGFGGAAAGDTVTARGPIWVTPAPDLQTFCRSTGLSGAALHLRVAQRLGLPPDDPSTRVVEFWVRPADLARPCPDPEITDRECELAPPGPRAMVRVDTAHTAWMQQTRDASYDGERRYPWTRLGYTYDWHPATSEVGTSEYILRPGADAVIHTLASTEAYCAKP
jgi:hypothetical protein